MEQRRDHYQTDYCVENAIAHLQPSDVLKSESGKYRLQRPPKVERIKSSGGDENAGHYAALGQHKQ